MSVAARHATRGEGARLRARLEQHLDIGLLLTVIALVGLGLVMVTSASMALADRQLGEPFYYLQRQLAFVGLGVAAMLVLYRIPLAYWEQAGFAVLMLALVLLVLVLIPGIGKEVNGSRRWLNLVFFNLQVSEVAKLCLAMYLASYLVRHVEQVRSSFLAFLRPVLVLGLASVLLLAEPDFGAAVVLMATGLGMLFLAGVRLGQFGLLLLVVAGALAVLAISSPYRVARLTAFLNPWADPFNSGFQLTQSLIAIGSGSWFGVGLGASVQKLFYLPEAHNDFLFAVLAEELGLLGVSVVIALFAYLVWRCFQIAAAAEHAGRRFGAYLAYGIGIWFGLQAFVNMGVNMGLLPTKGLTLPLMSAGGSSMIVMLASLGLVFRVYRETGVVVMPAVAAAPARASKRPPARPRGGRR
jgi:cell division protein FtsW